MTIFQPSQPQSHILVACAAGSGDAQSLAAALNHSALNVANALGPWLGGLAIAAGLVGR